MFETDLLRRAPAAFEFRQGGLRQVVENAAATVVDHNDYGVTSGRQSEAAEIVLAGQVTEQGDDAVMGFAQPERRRDIAVDAAGAPVAVTMDGAAGAAGMRVKPADGQRVADEQRAVSRDFVDQDGNVPSVAGRRQARVAFG